MHAGRTNTLLALEEPTEVVTNGDASVPYIQRGMAWCQVEWLGGSTLGATVQANVRIRTRFRSDVTIAPGWRLGGKFLVTAVGDPDGRRRELIILANEVQLPVRVS